jgi:hypothetical protein
MLPEKLEQLQSGDQSFWFRPMVATDSAEVTGVVNVTAIQLPVNVQFAKCQGHLFLFTVHMRHVRL